MSDLFTALGLVLVIEGSLYALFPDAMKRMMLALGTQRSSLLRSVGLGAAALGVAAVWLIRR